MKLKKLKTALTILVLTTSLAGPTHAIVEDRDTILKEGNAAPFYGVLVTPKNYRFYQLSVDKSDILDAKLKELSEAQAVTEDAISPAWYILGGFLLGLGGNAL